MKFGPEAYIKEIVDMIENGKLIYENSIVIGDNSSGKSFLLKEFMQITEMDSEIYFIDSVNRIFDVKLQSSIKEVPPLRKSILNTRLSEEFFNVKDSFNFYGTNTERVELIYNLFESEVQELFYELTGERFEISSEKRFGKVNFGDQAALLSSGFQAIIRILLELVYYQNVKASNVERAWVVIDEIDEFLSPKYASKFWPFLKEKFPWARWLVTTHSCDLVVSAENANLIILKDGIWEVRDVNDYNSLSEVQLLFERVFGRTLIHEDERDSILRTLLNNKMMNAWGDQEEQRLQQLLTDKLTPSQRLILKQIQEW